MPPEVAEAHAPPTTGGTPPRGAEPRPRPQPSFRLPQPQHAGGIAVAGDGVAAPFQARDLQRRAPVRVRDHPGDGLRDRLSLLRQPPALCRRAPCIDPLIRATGMLARQERAVAGQPVE